MPRRKRGLFARLGDASRQFWRALAGGSQYEAPTTPQKRLTPDEIRNLPVPDSGLPKQQRSRTYSAPENPEPTHSQLDAGASYPDSWGAPEIRLWDNEPQTYRTFYSQEDYEQLQEWFEKGWLTTASHSNPDFRDPGMTVEEREAWRELFYNLTGVVPSVFDWSAYREYLNEVGSPTV